MLFGKINNPVTDVLSPEVTATRLIPANDSVLVLTPTDTDAEAIFQHGIPDKLEAGGFTPLLPPDLRAQRTIICYGLDDLVYLNTEEEIAAEVEAQHEWAKEVSVFKFPRSPTAKITFSTGDMARKALLEGLHLFHIHVPGHQMRQEVFTSLMTCNRCNAVEQHSTGSCPHPREYMRCSECSSDTHTFRHCTATTKKCLHCGGEHSAWATHCPVRKEALRSKEEAARRGRIRSGVSHAQATQQPPPGTAPSAAPASPPGFSPSH